MKELLRKYIVYIAFIQAFLATFFSLFFSEILHFPPCVLCWYQRIFMYPIVLVILVGMFIKEKRIHYYVLPLSITGLLIASYHVLLQQGVIRESIAPCVQGISCTTKYIAFFGFMTIPLLSFISFFIITICMVVYKNVYKK